MVYLFLYRLGGGPKDAEEIKAHKFFSSISWDDLYHRKVSILFKTHSIFSQVTPPFKPKFNSELDTAYFAEEFTREQPKLTPPDYSKFITCFIIM